MTDEIYPQRFEFFDLEKFVQRLNSHVINPQTRSVELGYSLGLLLRDLLMAPFGGNDENSERYVLRRGVGAGMNFFGLDIGAVVGRVRLTKREEVSPSGSDGIYSEQLIFRTKTPILLKKDRVVPPVKITILVEDYCEPTRKDRALNWTGLYTRPVDYSKTVPTEWFLRDALIRR